MVRESERVYNFQRIFNIRLGKGLRANDKIPYRSAGPVTKEEYEARQERFYKITIVNDNDDVNASPFSRWVI